jgi:hypothetical protein
MWRGFMREVTQDWPIFDFPRPQGIVEQDVDAWSGGKPTQFTTQTVREVFIEGTVPGDDTTKVGLQVIPNPLDPEKYLLWVEGCAGVPETKGFMALEGDEPGHPDWQAANLEWISRAKQAPGTKGGPDPETKTETSYIFTNRTTPYGKSWGAPFAPTESCVGAPSPSPSLSASPSFSFTPEPSITAEPTPPPVITPPPTDAPTLPPIVTDPPPTEPPPTEPPQTEPPPTDLPTAAP